jgi:hypothetical protein
MPPIEHRRKETAVPRRVRRIIVVVSAGLLALSALPAAAAHASSTQTTCTGGIDVTYNPGLTLVAQGDIAVTATASLTCSSSDPSLTAAHGQRQYTDNISCVDLVNARSSVTTFTWNNKRSSTVTSQQDVTRLAGTTVVTFTGTVTSGEFAGDNFTEVAVALNPSPLQCLAPGGVTSLHFTAVITITGS